MIIKGHEVDINFEEELEPYMDLFNKHVIKGVKLQACSPFRHENHPSFAVNLDNGTWIDSGANEESDRKGNFISLLAFFRGEDYDSTTEYLLEKYTHLLDDTDTLKLSLNLSMNKEELTVLAKEKYEAVVNIPSMYLTNRGIPAKTQRYFNCGMGKEKDCVTLAWHNKDGAIVNVKYRSIEGKSFWFTKDGDPIKNHVYGLFAVRNMKANEVWCVESEIDCLYLWGQGIPAVAFGGASINERQKKLILNSCIDTIVTASDNDVVGQRFAKQLKEEFAGLLNVKSIKIPEGKKDINDLTPNEIKTCKETMTNFDYLLNLALN